MRGDDARPVSSGVNELSFSVSHSEEHAVLAITRVGWIGVNSERMWDDVRVDRLI